MESICKICERGREGQSEFCAHHKLGFDNLKTAYTLWRKAMDVDWRTFLTEVSGNQETGEWAREVAEHLLARDSIASPA